MKPDPQQVQRLGFEAWADNLIVNALEDMAGEPAFNVDLEQGDVTLRIISDGQQATAIVRAYVKGFGWRHHDRVIHLKGGRP